MDLVKIQQLLWCEPAAILPAMHRQVCEIVRDHATGAAHLAGGRLDGFEPMRCGIENGRHFDEERGWCGYRDGKASFDVPAGVSVEDGIATVFIRGVIAKRVSGVRTSSGVTDATNLEQALAFAREDPQVEGVLLDVDSPGGSVVGTPEVADMVAGLGKPTVAFTDSLMASAAYWIASAADVIVASRSASVGSIGVYAAFLDDSRRHELLGLRVELFKTGRYKGMGAPGIALTDDQRAHIQEGVDRVFGWFKDFVSAQRRIPAAAMEGQVFDAQEALAAGLIERVGSRSDAMEELRGLVSYMAGKKDHLAG